MLVLNTSRPLFKNNPKLRQAVNFAVDRKALTRELGPLAGTPTDQYLSPSQPGYTDERIYPLKAPDLRRARALANGHTRGGKAVLYTRSDPVDLAQAQVLQQNLKAIGLEVEIVQFPSLAALRKAGDGRGSSSTSAGFNGATRPIPTGSVSSSMGGRSVSWATRTGPISTRRNTIGCSTRRRGFRSGRSATAPTAGWMSSIARDAAPAIPFANINAMTFVSARTGCVVLNPSLDLGAVCLEP